jgi:hypothetical protein
VLIVKEWRLVIGKERNKSWARNKWREEEKLKIEKSKDEKMRL